MNAFCTLHNVPMEERTSTKKFDNFGKPKTYFGHMTPQGLCFGENTGKAKTAGRSYNPAAQQPPTPPQPSVDWDAIAEGKVRHGLCEAIITHGGLIPLTEEMMTIIDRWVVYIMKGRKAPKADDLQKIIEEDGGWLDGGS